MIISVNGREKKIAILDNGKVTEFYIERGEENTGIAGNIYKGRVMRVLPGMQSAFVEIGLERDAFLYVSDFFDEEEEIERIVMEKGKKTSKDDADPEVTDHLQKERLKREKQMEDTQELAEPLAESGADDDDEKEARKEARKEERKKRRKKKKKKKKRKKSRKANAANRGAVKKASRNRKKNPKKKPKKKTRTADDTEDDEEQYQPVFEYEDSGFERIIDDEDTGEMFKDAYMQEAIVDQVRAVEFDMESTGTAEVGSLIDAVSKDANGFQRIADEEDAEEKPKKKSTHSRRSKKRADDETTGESSDTEEKPKKKSTRKTAAAKKTTRNKPNAKTDENADESSDTEEKPKRTSRSRSRKSSAKAKKESRAKLRRMRTRVSANPIRFRKWQSGAAVAADGAAVAGMTEKTCNPINPNPPKAVRQTVIRTTRNNQRHRETTAREAAVGATIHSRRSPIFCAKVRKFSSRSPKNRLPAKAHASRRTSRFPADISFICRPSNISACRARSNRRANADGFVK